LALTTSFLAGAFTEVDVITKVFVVPCAAVDRMVTTILSGTLVAPEGAVPLPGNRAERYGYA
jgi:hypothetical protein